MNHHIKSVLAISIFTSLGLSACSPDSTPIPLNLDSVSAQSTLSDTESALKEAFGLLNLESEVGNVQESLKPTDSLTKRFEKLKESHPELYKKIKSMIDLPIAERKEKLMQLKKDSFQMMKSRGENMKRHRPEGKDHFFKDELKAQFGEGRPEHFRRKPPRSRKASQQRDRQSSQRQHRKYGSAGMNIQIQINGQSLRLGVPSDSRMMNAKQRGYNFKKGPHFNKDKRMDFGKGKAQFNLEDMKAKVEAWMAKNPELASRIEAFKKMSPEEKKANIKALIEAKMKAKVADK